MSNSLLPIAAIPIAFGVCVGLGLIGLITFTLTKRRAWLRLDDFDPDCITRTHEGVRRTFGDRSDLFLYVVRWLFLLFTAGTNLQAYVTTPCALCFYTIWNFSLISIFFTLLVTVSSMKLAKLDQGNFYKVLAYISGLLFEVEFSACILVDVVLWSILFSPSNPGDLLDFTNVTMHAANFFIMFIEFSFNDIPVRPMDVPWLFCWAIVYCYFSWVIYATLGVWVYFFLDLNVPQAVGWYFGLLALHSVFYYLVYFFFRIKIWIFGVTQNLPAGNLKSKDDLTSPDQPIEQPAPQLPDQSSPAEEEAKIS